MKRYEMNKDKRRFNYIIKNGQYNKDKYFVIYHAPRTDESINYGVAIKNSIGCAVVRNKLKRQTRSIIDKNKILFKKGQDYIIMIRNECLDCRFAEMDKSLATLLKGNR